MEKKDYRVEKDAVIKMFEKSGSNIVQHPAFNVLLNKIDNHFYNGFESDFTYQEDKIVSKLCDNDGREKWEYVTTMSLEPTALGQTKEISPVVKKEVFRYVNGVLEKYAVQNIEAKLNRDGSMIITEVEGISQCSEKDNSVSGLMAEQTFESNGLQIMSINHHNKIENPVALRTGGHYIEHQGISQAKNALVGSVKAYKELATKPGPNYSVTTVFRKTMNILGAYTVDSKGRHETEYSILREGHLQSFSYGDGTISEITPYSEQQIAELIANEPIPSVREGLKEYINASATFSYQPNNVEQSRQY